MASILNLSMEEKQAISDFYDDKKRKYEKRLEKNLRSLFNQIANDLKVVYETRGQIQSFSDYQDELTVILKKSYRETSKFFSEHYEREMQNKQDEGDNSELLVFLLLLRKRATPDIFIRIDREIRRIAPVHSAQIIKTTQNVVVSELQKAEATLSGGATAPTNQEVVDEALPNIKERNRNRAGTIPETEVGTATGIGSESEDDVFNTAVETQKKNPDLDNVLNPESIEELKTLELIKTWMSILDTVTREAHLAAHGQEVDVNDPFVVGGEKLMQPLDTSLGASLGNTINCRCNSISS